MNYLLLLVGAYLAAVNSRLSEVDFSVSDWNSFKLEHGKSYESKEVESLRRSVFAYNKHQIEQSNRQLNAEAAGFSLAPNHLTDVSQLEIKARNGFKLPVNHEELRLLENADEANEFLERILNDNSTELPDEVDWRKVAGRVSRVKNQGQCGSCWAFASTGALEGQEGARNGSSRYLSASAHEQVDAGDLVELSEQNLVDCVTADAGCNGGLMKDALEFVKQEGGIDDEHSYPYEARTRKCRFQKDKVAFSDSGAAILPSGDEEKLKQVVAKFGPVAVAIDASSLWFQFYRKGVFYNKHCHNKADELDHGVLVVGYGTDPKKGDYWIVKNSWGPAYGEKGYIRMARNRGNNCGIATVATIPTF